MQKKREKLLKAGYLIPMTADESRTWYHRHYYPEEQNPNPTWLAEDRRKISTHPHFKGPFTIKNMKWYHIYCLREDLIGNKNYWAKSRVDMFLPIIQRKTAYFYYINSELFDEQWPVYQE